MHGSPTLLVDGRDPFAAPGTAATVSCRLYRSADGRVDGAPSVEALRQILRTSAADTDNGPAAAVCCGYLRFFASRATAEQWTGAHTDLTGAVLDQLEAERRGADIFGSLPNN
ncbi:organomercurial lyase [Streptacidiphilus sp. MAP5-3]|uniref:organomercurial lyase n=1 Tax=unclassified Streptacidiphilus TaxID=2643834 RepID=UPI0035134D40